MRYIALSVIGLGYTRIAGILAYDMQNKEFPEITPAQARKLLVKGDLVGVNWVGTLEDGRFVVDEKFGYNNMLLKTGTGRFRYLDKDVLYEPVNSCYAVVRVLDTDYRGRLYEVVNNKCQRIKLTEQEIRGLSAIINIGGVFIDDEEIKVLDGIAYEDRRVAIDNVVNVVESIKEAEDNAKITTKSKKTTTSKSKMKK